MRVVFMGTPEFSVVALHALIEAGHEIVCAYSQPPRPAKRGQKERPSPVHAYSMAEWQSSYFEVNLNLLA